jgi:CDP-diacylglycerol--glycerol-3-phosphate 3-phosphatidyltransferase
MALNAIDGMLAKEFQQTTNLGAMLNELTDVVADTALYFSLSAHSLVSIDVLLLFIFLSNLSEFAGLSALSISKERRFDGPLGKSDRALFISLVALLSHYFTFQTSTMNYVFYAANILLIITIIKRVKNALS